MTYPHDTESPTPGQPDRRFTLADLPIDDLGRIYHLQLKPEQIAPDILLVGDPGRVEMIGTAFLRDLELEHENRGLVTITGISEITGERATVISPLRTTVATSGMGTPSLEIVANELALLNEIDFTTREPKDEFPRMHIVRVGTSGGLQSSTPLGTPVITTYSIGMDNTGLYYDVPCPDEACERIEQETASLVKNAMDRTSRFYGSIHPYVSRVEPTLVEALMEASEELGLPYKAGLTVSNSGFFAPQGRNIARIKPSVNDLDQIFSRYDPRLGGQCVENMEMEASFLIHFMNGLGHWAGAICPIIANRRKDTFTPQYQEAVKNAIRVALLALATLRSRDPSVLMKY